MFAQTSLPNENASLPLQVEADQPVLSQDVASGRGTRFLWTGFGFGVLVLIGLACALVPISSHDSAKPSRLFPEVATFVSVPTMSAMAKKKSSLSKFEKAAAAPAFGEVTKGLTQRKERQPISALRMSGTAGKPLSRRAALGAAAAANVLAYKASPALAFAGEGTMSKEEVIQIAKEKLTPFEQDVSLKGKSEKKFTGKTTNGYSQDNMEKGIYVGAISGAPIFQSTEKYDSGTGFPSFYAAVPGSVIERRDPQDYQNALVLGFGGVPIGNVRTEIIDAKSGAHLGHVFKERIIDVFPAESYQKWNNIDPTIFNAQRTFKRYSVNAAAMTFVPRPANSKGPPPIPISSPLQLSEMKAALRKSEIK